MESDMKRFSIVAIASLMAGCGVSEDKFWDRFIDGYCESFVECADEDEMIFFETADDCKVMMAFARGMSDLDSCDYSRKAAKACLKEIEGASCDDFNGDMGESCEDVYENCDEWGSSSSSYDTGE